jgi:hypothetical protein
MEAIKRLEDYLNFVFEELSNWFIKNPDSGLDMDDLPPELAVVFGDIRPLVRQCIAAGASGRDIGNVNIAFIEEYLLWINDDNEYMMSIMGYDIHTGFYMPKEIFLKGWVLDE